MRYIRKILNIRWDDERELQITNNQARKRFTDINTMDNTVSKRRVLYIGKIFRIPCKYIPASLISTFQSERRPLGKPNTTIRYSYINDIENIISNVSYCLR